MKSDRREIDSKAQETVVDVKQGLDGLAARLAAFQEEQRRIVQQKVADRTSLIGQAKRSQTLLEEARGLLFSYGTTYGQAEAVGQVDEADRKRWEQIQATVQDLEDQGANINRQIESLESKGEVMDIVETEAGKVEEEHKHKELEAKAEAIIAKARPELMARVRQFIKDLKALAERRSADLRVQTDFRNDASRYQRGIAETVAQVLEAYLRTGDDKSFLTQFYTAETAAQKLEALEVARRGMGWLSPKRPKAALDYILTRTRESFRKAQKAEEDLLRTEAPSLEEFRRDKDELKRRFKELKSQAETVDREVRALYGETSTSNRSSHSLSYEAENEISEAIHLGSRDLVNELYKEIERS